MKKIFLLPVTFLFFCSCDSQEVTMVKQQHLPYCETYTLEKLMGYIFDSPQWFETERADEPDSLFVSVCGVVKSQNVEEVCFTFDIVEDDQAVLVGYDYNGVAKVPGLAFRYFIPRCAERYKQHFNSEVDDISVILKEVLKEGKEETVEMLEQMKKLMDGVPMGEKTAEFIRRDAIIQTVTAGERSEVNIDSMRRALLDSVDQEQIRKNSEHTKNLHAWVWGLKENFYGAFANQYDLMYRDLRDENGNSGIFPLSVKVQNFCPDNDCHWASVLVQAWISGFTDTSSVTIDVNPNETEIFAPKLIFDNECLQNLNAPKQTQIQIRAYAMVGDNPTLFFTKSEPITIHPMQVNGS